MTFAGSPERVEARLVPEAGYEFDAFAVSGFPRRPGVALARAGLTAVRAPLACRSILERRRPDVVLGGGGYVAGPMVLAAWTERIPAALTEADAHLGLANRLAAPFAAASSSRTRSRAARARSTASSGGRFRRGHAGVAGGGAARVRAARRRARAARGGRARQGAQALNEAAVDAFADEGPAVLHLTGERDYEFVRSRVTRDDYVVLPSTDDSARPSRRPISRSRARAAPSGRSPPPACPPCSCRTRTRPPTTRRRTRATSSALAARSSCRTRS